MGKSFTFAGDPNGRVFGEPSDVCLDKITGIWYDHPYSPSTRGWVARPQFGGSGSELTVVNAPASDLDFSMLPNGVAPASGQYIAVDDLNIYTIKAGETQWFVTPR